MRYVNVESGLVALTTFGLLMFLFAGCQPEGSGGDANGNPAPATQNGSEPNETPASPLVPAPMSPEGSESESRQSQGAGESERESESEAESSRPNVDVDVGGGEGVQVDVDLPGRSGDNGSAEDQKDFQLDIGGGAIRVDVDGKDKDAENAPTP